MSLRLKTILGTALIEALLLIVLLSSLFRFMHNSNEQALLEYADNMSGLFASASKDAVLTYDLATIEAHIAETMKNNGIRYIRVFDMDGTLLASQSHEAYIENTFSLDRTLADVTDQIFDTAIDISEQGKHFGKVQMGISTNRINRSMNDALQWGIMIAAIEMILVAMFSCVLGYFLTRRLHRLRRAAKKVATGNLNANLRIIGNDEVSDVSRSFNTMISALRKTDLARRAYRKKLEQLNQDLEVRVQKRTQQLEQKNAQLTDTLSELKQAQSALLQSEKMASLGQMAAGVAHEINNPMAFIKSNVNSLQAYLDIYEANFQQYDNLIERCCDASDPGYIALRDYQKKQDMPFVKQDSIELIGDVVSGSDRIIDIVQGLKSFSRIDQAEVQCVEIENCIKDAIKISHNQIKFKCDIETHFGSSTRLCCNPGQLNQVFLNLLMNAAQAMEDFGKVTITTWDDTKNIYVEFKDTGKGISEEKITQIFDPFFTTKPVGEGTGLGLSVSHGIIEDHGGNIDVHSEIGIGTRFLLTLPIDFQKPLEQAAG